MVRAGRIVFGVEDQTLRVVGVPDDQVFTIMDAISNAIADSCEPLMIILEGSMQDMLVQNGPMKSSSIADQLGVQKKESSPVCVVRGGIGVVAGFFLCAGMKGAFSC